jgi:hypothetical protein
MTLKASATSNGAAHPHITETTRSGHPTGLAPRVRNGLRGAAVFFNKKKCENRSEAQNDFFVFLK